jgi:hypothetical protein
MTTSNPPGLSENLLSILAQVQNYQSHLTQNSSKYLDYPNQHYVIEVFPYQDHGEEVEEKTRVEGKIIS